MYAAHDNPRWLAVLQFGHRDVEQPGHSKLSALPINPSDWKRSRSRNAAHCGFVLEAVNEKLEVAGCLLKVINKY
jgi:hypothetical protein